VSELPVLGPEEQRILGSLLEKQVTVPASYPLTANALRTACNQTSSRDPVVDYDERTVERVARELKDRGLLRIVWADTGRRTLKYHQVLDEQKQKVRESSHAALIGWAQSAGEGTDYTDNEPLQCLHRMLRPECPASGGAILAQACVTARLRE